MHINVFIINNFNVTEFFPPTNEKNHKSRKAKTIVSCSLEHTRQKNKDSHMVTSTIILWNKFR